MARLRAAAFAETTFAAHGQSNPRSDLGALAFAADGKRIPARDHSRVPGFVARRNADPNVAVQSQQRQRLRPNAFSRGSEHRWRRTHLPVDERPGVRFVLLRLRDALAGGGTGRYSFEGA